MLTGWLADLQLSQGVGDAVGGLGKTAQAAGGALRPKSGLADTDIDTVEPVGINVDDMKKDMETTYPRTDTDTRATDNVKDTAWELGSKGKEIAGETVDL